VRLHAPLFAAVEERSEKFSLCSGTGAGDLVAGIIPGRNVFVGDRLGDKSISSGIALSPPG